LALEGLEGRTLLTILTSGIPTWIEQGPAPIHLGGLNPDAVGAIQAIAADPANADNLYIGSVNGGIWHSTNATASRPTWIPQTDQLPSLSIGSIAFSPLDRHTLFAGIADDSHLCFCGGSLLGLLRTTDGGQHWSLIAQGTFNGTIVNRVLPTSIFTSSQPGLANEVVLVAADSGLYRSQDGGTSFTQALNLRATDVVEAHSNGQTFLYAGVAGSGVLRSADGGLNWTPVNSGITGLSVSTNIRLAVHKDPTNDVLYAMVANNVSFGQLTGVFRSTDQGQSWSSLGVPVSGLGADITDSAFAADAVDPYVVYFGGYIAALYRGDARNNSWTPIFNANGTSPHTDSRAMGFDALGNLLESDDGGIYRLSTPNNPSTRVWRSVNGTLRLSEFVSVAYDDVNDIIFGGTQDNGNVQQTTRGGLIWSQVDYGDGYIQAVDNSDPNAVRRYSELAGIHRRTYNSQNQLIDQATVQGGTLYVLNAINPARMLSGDSRLYESLNRVDSATDITALIPNLRSVIALGYGGRITAKGQVNPDIAYVGILDTQNQPAVYLRTAAGGSFTKLSYPGGALVGPYIVLDPDDWHTAYLLDQGYHDVWQVRNAGESTEIWTKITGNLNDRTGYPGNQGLHSLEVVKVGTTTVVLVGDQNGLYRTLLPNGTWTGSWVRFGANLPNTWVNDVHYDARDDLLIIGTLGRGAWTLPGASSYLTAPAVLQVYGDQDFPNENDTIRLVPDAYNPLLLDVFINNPSSTPNYSVPFSSLQQVIVSGRGGDDAIRVEIPGIDLAATVNGGDGNDTIDVEAVGPGTTVWINGENGDDRVYVSGIATNLDRIVGDPIMGAVHVDGGAGFNTMDVDDRANPFSSGYGITSGAITRLRPSGTVVSVLYANLAEFEVYAGTGSDTIHIQSATPSTAVLVEAGPGNDQINLAGVGDPDHPSLSNLGSITGSLTIDGEGGSDSLYIDDRGNGAGAVFAITNGMVTRSRPSVPTTAITYVALEGLQIDAGTGGDEFDVQGTAAATPVTINSGDGNDTVNVRGTTSALNINGNSGNDTVNIGSMAPSSSGTLTGITGPISVANSSGTTTLNIDDTGYTAARTATITGNSITGLAPAAINYTAGQVSALQISGGRGGNTFTVQNTGSGTSTTLNSGTGGDTVNVRATTGPLNIEGNAGSDAVNIGSASGTLLGITGPVSVANSSGTTALTVNDSGETSARTATITDGSITGLAPAAISYTPSNGSGAQITALTVNGGNANDTVNVQSTSASTPVTVNGGGGNDTVNVGGTADTLDTILGPVTANGQAGTGDTLNLKDQGSSAAHSYTVTATTVNRGMGLITFGTMERTNVTAGSGDDLFTMGLPVPTTAVVLDGSSGANTLAGVNTSNTWTIQSAGAGLLGTKVNFSNIRNLVGGSGNDTFKFTAAGSLSGTVNGGAGTNTLDYSARTSDVTVNLVTGAATSIGGGVTAIQNVNGGSGNDRLTGNGGNNILRGNGGNDALEGGLGNDILIGGAGTDTITDAGGRNLLIGGSGADTLTGSSSDDIIIGADTTYDNNDTALLAIMNEWTGPSDYATRIGHLKGTIGGGLNGSTLLNASKIIDDAIADLMTGGSGLDWFFAAIPPDTITDHASGEVIN
jgi:Ca2+-binding RTX toxin-like protein